MLTAIILLVSTQAPRCELPAHRTAATAEQPLRFADGTPFGTIAPPRCLGEDAPVSSSAVIDADGSVEATFSSKGITVKSSGQLQLYSDKGTPLQLGKVDGDRVLARPVMRGDLVLSTIACRDLRLMPDAEVSPDPRAAVCDRADFTDRSLECPGKVELYVKNGEKRQHAPTDRLERVGSIDAHTVLHRVVDHSGWTQVSPDEPVPFQLSDGWTWWVRTSALAGCRRPSAASPTGAPPPPAR